ncbi:MAG: 30S ribosomal protein S8 [Ezakiella sp.]|nr:30S ribosomal protein S8 [Ezakiella sp.]MDD7761244.1 30S ribosomal protein S8 [Bacillota bacterium]MDY3947585.1 30S ribosomal protein S8 [Ezakiella sp.]
MLTDPIADMLTRIRNANHQRHESVDVPASKIKLAIAEILKEEGFIEGYEILEGDVQNTIRIALKYVNKKERVITGIRRISKPGLRIYVNSNELPKVLGGLGIAIISTSKGIMTDKEARANKVGGEVICYVW